MTNRKKCVLPIYLFLSVLLKSTSLKCWFYILDFSALDINLSSLNCNQGSYNSVTEENKFFYHKIFKNPLTIISNQDIFFLQMERLEACSETSLGKTSKQTSFHFILLTISHNQLTWSNSSTVSNFDKFPTKDLHKLMIRNGRLE